MDRRSSKPTARRARSASSAVHRGSLGIHLDNGGQNLTAKEKIVLVLFDDDACLASHSSSVSPADAQFKARLLGSIPSGQRVGMALGSCPPINGVGTGPYHANALLCRIAQRGRVYMLALGKVSCIALERVTQLPTYFLISSGQSSR